jgi:glycosyltransferase involved in cell wall biosynthesis
MPAATISVIIPAFNAEMYIAEAIDSVVRQDVHPAEIIVVDDGSTDGTAELVRRWPDIRLVRQENAGVAAALNHGIRLAQGEMLAFLSADDVWEPHKLRLQIEEARHPAHLVFGHMQHFISPEIAAEAAQALVCPPDPMPAFSAGTLLTRRGSFTTVGPFSEAFAVGEFMEWYGRAVDLGLRVIMLDQIVSRRRVHAHNHSTTALRENSYAPVLRAIIARRRAAAARQ